MRNEIRLKFGMKFGTSRKNEIRDIQEIWDIQHPEIRDIQEKGHINGWVSAKPY